MEISEKEVIELFYNGDKDAYIESLKFTIKLLAESSQYWRNKYLELKTTNQNNEETCDI